MIEKEEKPVRRPITIKAQKEFTPEQISKARKKNPKFALEMEIYNVRALRGDFDTY